MSIYKVTVESVFLDNGSTFHVCAKSINAAMKKTQEFIALRNAIKDVKTYGDIKSIEFIGEEIDF